MTVTALGLLLGMRHATDADHVLAVTTIVTRQRELSGAALTGLLWGLGHSMTVLAVGSLIIAFKLVIPYRIGVGMEVSVGLMLIALGVSNLASFVSRSGSGRRTESDRTHGHLHSHGDYVHNHPPGNKPHVHPHQPDQTPLAAIDRRFSRSQVYMYARPVVVGVVHGLAGSSAVSLLVVAAVREPRWSIAYLIVFGMGTIAGMTLITIVVGSALRSVGDRSGVAGRHIGFACGVFSILFGLSFAYQVLSNGIPVAAP